MKIKFYILFLMLTVVLMGLAYFLLSQFYKDAGWAAEWPSAAGIIITSILLIRIYMRFMKTPQGKENR